MIYERKAPTEMSRVQIGRAHVQKENNWESFIPQAREESGQMGFLDGPA